MPDAAERGHPAGTRATAPLRVAIAGLGRMGDRWIDAASGSRYALAALFDPAPAPFALERRPELRPHRAADAATFWASRPDILVVATTAPAHAPLLAAGLEHGIRRFVIEKPFATSCDEAAAMVAQAERAGARVIVNHGRDYAPNYKRLGEVAHRFGLGDLRAISVTIGAAGTGCVGIHFFRLFNRLFGVRPQMVLALGTTPRAPNPRGPQFDDPGSAAMIVYPGERRAHLDIGDDVGVAPKIELIFARGRVLIESDVEPWTVQHRTAEALDEPLTRYGAPTTISPFPDFVPFGIVDMARAALADAASDAPPVCDMHAGAETMELFSAVRWSMTTGGAVSLPLPPAARAACYSIP